MPGIIDVFTFEQLINIVQEELRKSVLLTYVNDDSIIVTTKALVEAPTFTDYLIRLSSPDSGFLSKHPRIGQYFRVEYFVGVDLWIKSSGKATERLEEGVVQKKVGIWEFFDDLSRTLEHNNFDNQLDSYPGSNIGNPVTLPSDDSLLEGVGFIWYGNQNNLK